MSLILAVDAGGTSTRAVVIDPSGRALGYGRAGGGNPLSSGPAIAAQSLGTAVRDALTQAHADAASVASATIAMAGAATHLPPSQARNRVIGETLAGCGVTAAFALRSDLLAMFCAGTSALDGYALGAGTGAAAIRVRGGVIEHVVDGMGWLLGDAGSGFSVGHAVARAVVAALDGRGPATAMTAGMLEMLALSAETATSTGPRHPLLDAMVELLYERPPVRVAEFAPLAFAYPDDAVARTIVDDTAAALAHTVAAAIAPDVDGPLVLGGSVLIRQEATSKAVESAWRDRGRTGPVHRVAEGTTGAAVLALRHGGTEVDDVVFARVQESLAALR